MIAIRERASAVEWVEVPPDEQPELHAIVERLCVVADLPKPELVIDHEKHPNSWVVSLGRGRRACTSTKALLDRLDAHQLEAVIAHELAHIAHRDATVMTVVGGPAAILLGGGERGTRIGMFPINVGAVIAVAIGWVASLGTLALSRYREFAADAGAVALTGNPAALASALMAVSDDVRKLPYRDLRDVVARDPFHLLPVGKTRGLLASHPSLDARIARLAAARVEPAVRSSASCRTQPGCSAR